MPPTPPTPEPLCDATGTPLPDTSFEVAAHQLEALATFGLNLVRLVHDTADRLAALPATECAERLPPLVRAFDRLSRGVRQAIALRHRIATDRARDQARATTRAESRTALRSRLIRAVEDTIHRTRPAERDTLLADLHERLDDPILDIDLLTRNLDEVAEELRRDYGIGACHPTHARRRTAAEIRALRQRAAAPAPAPVTPFAPHPAPHLARC